MRPTHSSSVCPITQLCQLVSSPRRLSQSPERHRDRHNSHRSRCCWSVLHKSVAIVSQMPNASSYVDAKTAIFQGAQLHNREREREVDALRLHIYHTIKQHTTPLRSPTHHNLGEHYCTTAHIHTSFQFSYGTINARTRIQSIVKAA